MLMTDVTQILSQIDQGNPNAAEQLLPVVYDELRRLAAARLANEKPDQTLQATALVHEAYLRLVGGEPEQHWNSRGHFFAAAAEAMRRILVESARRKSRLKHGGQINKQPITAVEIPDGKTTDEMLAINDALANLAEKDEVAATLVKLRYFVGMTVEEAADALGISVRTAYYTWDYARSWLRSELSPD